MAAPSVKNIQDLSGNWAMNKQLSDSPDPMLQVQGVGYLTRKGITMGKVSLTLKQYQQVPGPPNTGTFKATCIESTPSASGIKGVREIRYLDNEPREQNDWLFGTVEARAKWTNLDEIEDEFLKKDWFFENEDHQLILNHATSERLGWVAIEVWGFQMINGEKRYCSRVKVLSGRKKSAQALFVYDYISE